MKRKTIDVIEIKNTVNKFLAISDNTTHVPDSTVWIAMRRGQATLLEDILMKTGNYRGFRYLKQEELPIGAVPGIREDRSFENTDSSRVAYI